MAVAKWKYLPAPCCPGVVVSYRCTVQVPTILCEQEVNKVVAITNADNFNVFTVITLFILDSNIVVFYGLYNCFIFLACRERIAYNGKRLCEGGAKKFKIFYKHELEQKLFPFFKITKKLKNGKVFCGYFLEFFWDFLQPRLLQIQC